MGNHAGESDFDKSRFENFFDAILAILITILVLEFKVPEMQNASTAALQDVIVHYLPQILSYLMSFATIIALWIDHHKLMRRCTRITKNFIRLNFLFILFLSPLPFTTSFAGRYIENSFAVALLAANFFFMNLGFGIVFSYAIVKKIIPPPEKGTKDKQYENISKAGLLLLLASVPLAFVNPYIPFFIFPIVISLHLFK
jgi:uncharacterized membrane protein